MAAYSSGSATVRAGSAKVYGSLTSWSTYLGVGDLFKLDGENVFYDIAAINSATELTLTSRYSNTNYQSVVATNVASVTLATEMYSGNVGSFTPVIQNSFVLEASPNGGGERFTDNGAGVLTGEGSPAGSGTIDYDSGAWAIILGTDVTATLNLAASFSRGSEAAAMSYQAIVDFTPNYQIPEMSLNDINFPHIFTKAVRKIDQKIKAATDVTGVKSITASYLEVYAVATLNNANIVNASLTNASISKAKITNASITNASITNLLTTGVIKTKINPKKADYAATPSDGTIVVSDSTASIVIRLPYANVNTLGARLTIINNSGSVVKASACAGQTVNASPAVFLKAQYETVTVIVATTAKWIKI